LNVSEYKKTNIIARFDKRTGCKSVNEVNAMNNETITTRTIKRGFADVNEEFVLEDTAHTRITFKAQIHNNGVRGCLYRYKKDAKEIMM